MGAFKEPHGGVLKNLYLNAADAEQEKQKSRDYPSWDLSERKLCDIELLLNGAFSPLEGFVGQADYDSVLKDMRLTNGMLWPIPVNLDVSEEFAESLDTGKRIALRDTEGVLIAILDVDEKWQPNKQLEAECVYGTTDIDHPGVDYLLNHTGPVYLAGKLHGIESPHHYDFRHLRYSPQELRDYFEKLGWRRVVAFQTRNPMHRAHQELTVRAVRECEANLLIHPVVGHSIAGDIDRFARVRCYERLLREYPEQTTALSLLPLAMRMAGPREALWHAIIRKNYGCTHFIIGHDHAGPGKDGNGEPFYSPYAAQELLEQYQDELDITPVPFKRMVYVVNRAQYLPEDEVKDNQRTLEISSAEFRRRLREGLKIDDWFSYPAVVEELRKTIPPRDRQGLTIFFTGLSGAGKSTIANALMVKLMEQGRRRVTLLDGDIVRKNLSSELGFSHEHRDLNIQRIGFVASEITKNGGIAICAPIAPYKSTRRKVRSMIEAVGGFIEVYVSTSLEECEARDRKGLYARARAGIIPEFTGISDPYEVPERAEMEIDTKNLTPDLAAHRIIIKLESLGFIR
ncbi:MAG: bifunctional sulfate adenylyltransferase/adenylylsulfate kinase [Gammaproteobacteria bacterium]|nr:bifunctional sulfate adenylyltransferase/adenylylsulfate kinase [Gammaproteobacteria bacterium]